jgi:hypothetical protein
LSTLSWTYSGDPSDSDVDQVRFTLQDTDTGFQLLQDEEIQWLIDFWKLRVDDLTFVASVAAEVVSRKFAGIVNVSADGVSVDTSTLAERYHTSAIRLREQYKDGAIASVNLDNLLIGSRPDWSMAPLRFGMGLHDNSEAGSQDFGGMSYHEFGIDEVMNGLWG